MPKTIVFCADGTWNGPGEPDHDDPSAPPTNVFKLFLKLAGADTPETLPLGREQERVLAAADGPVQVAKYLHGVGDSSNPLVHLLGGSLGEGLIMRIVRGYTFISRNHVQGDRIFITGFSRGAYTARALGGLINNQGLLNAKTVDLDDRMAAYRLGAGAWYAWRRSVISPGWAERLASFVFDLPGFFTQPPAAEQRVPARIAAVAVWDTVGALGIPAYTLHDTRLDLLQFADLNLPAAVDRGFQAIAVDERRVDFTPTFWNPDPRATQVLFPGAHADVGGGYAFTESGLSDCSLAWLVSALAGLGVWFAGAAAGPAGDPLGFAHQPWTSPPWTLLDQAPREIPGGFDLSDCLLTRFRDGDVRAAPGLPPAPYRPANLGAYPAFAIA